MADPGPPTEYQQAAAAFPTPAFIEPDAMRDLLLANKQGGGDRATKKKIQVVDVRGSDFKGGKLPGAINVPTDAFKDDEKVDRLVGELKDKTDLIVLHCGKSIQRGPFAAGRFLSRMHATAAAAATGTGADGSKAVLPEVMVLKGGFEAWEALCGGDEGMVEPLGDGGDGVATK